MSLDPRPAVIGRRLDDVGRVIAVTGGKGGIGKTWTACGLALVLAAEGYRVGLLDLDLTGACAHVTLGIEPALPAEDRGIVPPLAAGLRFMSIACFCGPQPAPLRGADVSNALTELLCITQWGALDYLIVDMPPGLGDAALDAARLLPQAEYLVLSTASRVSTETVRRMIELLRRLNVRILGLVENMRRADGDAVQALAAQAGVPCLGAIPFDAGLEEALGDSRKLLGTKAAAALRPVARRLADL